MSMREEVAARAETVARVPYAPRRLHQELRPGAGWRRDETPRIEAEIAKTEVKKSVPDRSHKAFDH